MILYYLKICFVDCIKDFVTYTGMMVVGLDLEHLVTAEGLQELRATPQSNITILRNMLRTGDTGNGHSNCNSYLTDFNDS